MEEFVLVHDVILPCAISQHSSWAPPCPFISCSVLAVAGLERGVATNERVECEQKVEEILYSELYKVTDKVDGAVAVNANVPNPVINAEIKGAAEISQKSSVIVKKRHVTQTVLESLKDKRKINMSNTLIKEVEEEKQNVYVVTATIEAEQEATIETSGSLEGSICIFLSKMGIQSKGRRQKSITVPKGSVLGFGVQLLTIRNGKWAVSHIPSKEEQTFQSDNFKALEISQKGFPLTKAKIQEGWSNLDSLPSEIAGDFLNAFICIMKDPKTLTEVEDRLEQSLYREINESIGHLEPSVSKLLEHLGLSSTPLRPCREVIQAVLFFLDALSELGEGGAPLLLESLQKQNTGQRLTQVEKILEENFIGSENLDAGQMSPREAAARQTEARGTEPEFWNPEVQSCATALYAALYVLHRLSQTSSSR